MRLALIAIIWASSVAALLGAEDKLDELPAEIFQSWIHSREEDKDAVLAYRPKGHKFPPARGRAGFEIEKDGKFIDRPIAPADGNESVVGKWAPAGAGKIKVTFPLDPKRKAFTLEIVSCDGKLLRVRRAEAE